MPDFRLTPFRLGLLQRLHRREWRTADEVFFWRSSTEHGIKQALGRLESEGYVEAQLRDPYATTSKERRRAVVEYRLTDAGERAVRDA